MTVLVDERRGDVHETIWVAVCLLCGAVKYCHSRTGENVDEYEERALPEIEGVPAEVYERAARLVWESRR